MRLSRQIISAIRHRFSLSEDKADPSDIDQDIRSAINMEGSNLWVLMLAIMIASIGLNVNSTAVIIGAMLISPLMGPIMGIGYGLGIYDFTLIRKSLTHLGVATAISLMVSTCYFLITPLSEAHSELLARTQPTIYDVMIAFTGGLAGIVGATRKIKTNVIPGVAIATALMPPLCTAGYGLATAKWGFFFGAGYLYLINCVFIALAAVLIISTSRLPHKTFVDQATENRIKTWLSTIVLVMLIPSTYLAYKLVNEEVFTSKVNAFISNQMLFEDVHITELNINPKDKVIEISLIGRPIPQSEISKINVRINKEVDSETTLIMHQAGQEKIDTFSLKSSILSELYKDSQVSLESKNKELELLRTQLSDLQSTRKQMNNTIEDIRILFPQVHYVSIANGLESESNAVTNDVTIVLLKLSKKLTQEEQTRMLNWLRKKLGTNKVTLTTEINP